MIDRYLIAAVIAGALAGYLLAQMREEWGE